MVRTNWVTPALVRKPVSETLSGTGPHSDGLGEHDS